MTTLRTHLAAAVVLATCGAALLPPPVAARVHDGQVERRGSCTNGARWEIKAKYDDGRIEVEAEVDTVRTGRRWEWVLTHNGSRSARGVARTRGPSGSFEVERRTVDVPGADDYRFRATRGRVRCVATVTY